MSAGKLKEAEANGLVRSFLGDGEERWSAGDRGGKTTEKHRKMGLGQYL